MLKYHWNTTKKKTDQKVMQTFLSGPKTHKVKVETKSLQKGCHKSKEFENDA